MGGVFGAKKIMEKHPVAKLAAKHPVAKLATKHPVLKATGASEPINNLLGKS